MTHSLHRYRQDNNPGDDFIFLCTPAIGTNHYGAAPKLVKMLELVLKYQPANINFYENYQEKPDIEAIKKMFTDTSRIRCCFSSYEKIKKLLAEIREMQFGLSVCVSGPLNRLECLSKELGLPIHSINLSCGFLGNKDLLPDNDVLEVTSMCGHGLIASALVERMFFLLTHGQNTPAEALDLINRQCICGLVNKEKLKKICERKQQEGIVFINT